MMKKVFCYFHNDDLDGWASSAVVKMKYPNAEFCGYNYEPNIQLVKGYDIVFMVDCSVSGKDMKQLINDNTKFVWIDHHAKTIWDMEELRDVCGLRDTGNNNSACVLTWKYLFPKKRIPDILLSIEDMDIWKWKLPFTDEINTALFIDYKGNREGILQLMNWEGATDLSILVNKGKNYIAMRKNQINFLLQTMRIKQFHGYKTGIVNSPIHTSFVGHEILERNPDIQIAMIWYTFGNDVIVSLRSKEIDVAKIASIYGGGGHKLASGFRLDIANTKFMSEIIGGKK